MRMKNKKLEILAKKIRINALLTIYSAGSGHPGGVLSSADMIAYLYEHELRDVGSEEKTNRDRFILSKGHACPALYAAFVEKKIISRNDLASFRKLGGLLQGHPHVETTPWVEASTGSLGQGFSVAIGMSIGYRHQGYERRIYVMLGDGELQEGEVWEGLMCAAHYGLDNLCAIVDYNKMQSDDLNENIMKLEPLKDKFLSFNWHVIEIDGHEFDQIESAFSEARSIKEKPTVILAHTIKGKGVSYMESSPLWHGSVALRDEELVRALSDLGVPDSEAAQYIKGVQQ